MRWSEKPYYLLLLSLLSGFLLWFGWPTKPFPWAMFVAFVPLLLLEEKISSSDKKRKLIRFLGYSYLSLLVWNILSTYWIYNSTAIGGSFAMAANAALMCIPLLFFFFTKRWTNQTLGLISFVLYWITFEYIHLNWNLSWPWLTLGNAFASQTTLIQWYEYTGVFGGSLWILVANVLIFLIVKKKAFRVGEAVSTTLLVWLFLPLLVSIWMYVTYEEKGEETEVVVVQPNIDPYEEKFSGSSRFIPYEEQLDRLIRLSEKKIGPETKYVVWPETALPYGYFENKIHADPVIQQLKSFVAKHKHISLITGLDTYSLYKSKETPSCIYRENVGYIDAFNTAMQINEENEIELYRKSKLVPGVEYMPPSLSDFAIALGESAGGLGRQENRAVFFNQDSTGVAPVICYESIFGEFVTDYIKNGANLIFIITNDGWWGNTQGHKQHLQFASLRAIETRKSIARSANTGISGFINQRGDIIARSEYWKQDVMKMKIKENDIRTFYSRHGDYMAWTANAGSFVILVVALISLFRKEKKHYS